MSQLPFDEETSQRLEKRCRTRDALRRRRLVREAVGARVGERILDVGCGGGFYLAELLDAIGADGSLVGVDSSPAMLAIAARRCDGHDNVTFRFTEAPLRRGLAGCGGLSPGVQSWVRMPSTCWRRCGMSLLIACHTIATSMSK